MAFSQKLSLRAYSFSFKKWKGKNPEQILPLNAKVIFNRLQDGEERTYEYTSALDLIVDFIGANTDVDDKEVREDIVSDVFTSLWDKLDTDSFDLQSETALGYIKMCVKNSCLNFLKHQEYEWSYAENIQKKAPLYETETDSVYTFDELYRMLYETLNKLPENYRTVFMKSFFEGKTHAEIAEEMNLSVKSINRYKQKTMELLRNELKDYLPLFLLFLSPEQL